jgi:hypothetical protein
VNRILKPVTYVLAAAYFLVDAVFSVVAKPISDCLDHSGTGETCSGLSGRNRSDRDQCSDTGRRRTFEARPGRAPVQSHPRQADEDSSIRLDVRPVPTSQSMVGSHRGLANHTVVEQCRPQLRTADEDFRCCAVSPALKAKRKRAGAAFPDALSASRAKRCSGVPGGAQCCAQCERAVRSAGWAECGLLEPLWLQLDATRISVRQRDQSTTIFTRSRVLTCACASSPFSTRKRSVG